MAIEIYEGYESNELPPIEQRVADATHLAEMNYIAVLGVATNREDLHRAITAETRVSTTQPENGDYLIGPYVMDAEGDYFTPHGLSLWKKIHSQDVIT